MKYPGTEPTIKEILESVINEMVSGGILWNEACNQFEKLFIIRALQERNGRVSDAAELMGIHRNTLSRKIREHGIDRHEL